MKFIITNEQKENNTKKDPFIIQKFYNSGHKKRRTQDVVEC